MRLVLRTAARLGCVVLAGLVATGCTLPRSGPTAGEIRAAGTTPGYDMHIVNVNPTIAGQTRVDAKLGFGANFLNAGTVSPDTISPGDRVEVTVWENVDNGVLSGVGQKATVLKELQVDQSGEIYVPYAGRLRAAGLDPEALRGEITRGFESQTPDPQVEVRRVAGGGVQLSPPKAVDQQDHVAVGRRQAQRALEAGQAQPRREARQDVAQRGLRVAGKDGGRHAQPAASCSAVAKFTRRSTLSSPSAATLMRTVRSSSRFWAS